MNRTRADSPTKNCTIDGCDHALRARGLCGTHYNQRHQPERHKPKPTTCVMCDEPITKASGGGRKHGSVCSDLCRTRMTFGWSEPLPDDHWARWYGRSTPIWPRRCERCGRSFIARTDTALRCATCTNRALADVPRFTTGQCADCASWYTVEANGSPTRYCSRRCMRRVARRIRRAHEYGASGVYRYTEVLRLWIASGKRCAYCDTTIDQLPEPEHVTPISRGGRNDITNLLAACRHCNREKGDATPDEWNQWRLARSLSSIRTDFPVTDKRFAHLVLTSPSRPRWVDSLVA